MDGQEQQLLQCTHLNMGTLCRNLLVVTDSPCKMTPNMDLYFLIRGSYEGQKPITFWGPEGS